MLTRKQKELYYAIDWFIKEYGFSPTLNELGNMLYKTKTAVFYLVMELERKGYVKTSYGKGRTIKIIKELEE